jgi:hypothetical protein
MQLPGHRLLAHSSVDDDIHHRHHQKPSLATSML